MPEAPPQTIAEVVERPRVDAAAAAKLRALAQQGFSAREFAASVSRTEIAALVGLVLLVVSAAVIYTWKILPEQVASVQLAGQISDNNAKIEELGRTISDPSEVTRQFVEVQSSLDAFRSATLRPRLEGRRAIIEAIGRLSSETGVQLDSAVEFDTRDPRAEAAADAKSKRNVVGGEKRDIVSYPSLEVSFAVTGTYEQLRRFIGRLEGSDQFVVIESVSLATGDEEDAPTGPRRRGQGGRQSGAVSLEISLTAYFQAETPLAVQ